MQNDNATKTRAPNDISSQHTRGIAGQTLTTCTSGQSSNAPSATSQVDGIVNDFSAVHPPKATNSIPYKLQPAIDVTSRGIVKDVSDLHPPKAQPPIDVTQSGIAKDVRDAHPVNAHSPIDVTEDGIVTDINDEHNAKA
jgi:hypothetical protein